MGDSALPKRMFRLGEEPEGRKRVNNYFTLRWIEIIKGALDDAQQAKLLGSQFGKLMLMGNHQFSVMFLHYILSRQLVTEKKYEMWWLFAGKPIRFAIEDFALVTGLNCSKIGFNKADVKGKGKRRVSQHRNRFFKTLFGNETKPTTKWIAGKLALGKKYKDAATRFRLALLLLVDGILRPTCAQTIISLEIVEMLKDVDGFLSYPWGRSSFLTTVLSAKQKTTHDLAQDTTAIQGFPHALVLVTLMSCPAIIYSPGDPVNIVDPTLPIHKVLDDVLGRSLNINVQDARSIDQTGMERVTSILNEALFEEGVDLNFSDEEDDEEVSYMVSLIGEEHQFEHNSWSGGVAASEVLLSSADEEEEPVDSASGNNGSEDVEVDGTAENVGSEEVPQETHGIGERDKYNCVTQPAGNAIKAALLRDAVAAFEESFVKLQEANNEKLKAYFDGKLNILTSEVVALKDSLSSLHNANIEKLKLYFDEKLSFFRSHGGEGTSASNGGGYQCRGTDFVPTKTPDGIDKSQKTVPEVSIGSKRPCEDPVDSIINQVCSELKKKRSSPEEIDGGVQSKRTRHGGSGDVSPPSFSIGLTQMEKSDPLSSFRTDQPPEQHRGAGGKQPQSTDIGVKQGEKPGMKNTEDVEHRYSRRSRSCTERQVNRYQTTPSLSDTASSRGSPSKAPKHVKETESSFRNLVGSFNPFRLPQAERVNCFLKAMERATSYSLKDGLVMDSTEFLTIYQADTFLDETGADMLVKFIQLRLQKQPNSRFDFLPSQWVSEIRRQLNRFHIQSVKTGFQWSSLSRVPFQTRPQWLTQVDTVYCPVQIERQHWVGAVIELKKSEVILLDCNRKCLSDSQTETYLEHLTLMLPFLIRKHGVNGLMLTNSLQPLTIVRPSLQFQCSSAGLVGIATILLLELHSVNALDCCRFLDEEMIRTAAKHYAIEAFNAFAPEAIPT